MGLKHAFRFVPVLFLCLLARAPAWQMPLHDVSPNNAPGFGLVAGEVGGAVVAGSVLGLGLGYAVVRATGGPHYDPSESSILPLIAGIGGLALGHAAGSALGTWLVGSIAQQDHRASGAFLGALAGLPVSFVLVTVAWTGNVKSPALLLIPAFAAPPAGAVIGYNLSPSCGCTQASRSGDRLLPPTVGLRHVAGDTETVVALDMKLLNVRF